MSVLAERLDQGGVARGRLGAHVRQQVDLGLLHPRIGGRSRAVVLLVQAPGPLHAARGEHQGPAGRTVQGQLWVVVSGC